MDNLLIANIPHSCDDIELRSWIEQHGFRVGALRLIRDVISGSSPSFATVRLATAAAADGAVRVLDQKPLRNRRIYVRRGRSPLDE